jgi:hypothetical protein
LRRFPVLSMGAAKFFGIMQNFLKKQVTARNPEQRRAWSRGVQ